MDSTTLDDIVALIVDSNLVATAPSTTVGTRPQRNRRLPTKFTDYTGLPYLLQNQNVVNTALTTEESTSLPSVSDIQPAPALTEPLYYK